MQGYQRVTVIISNHADHFLTQLIVNPESHRIEKIIYEKLLHNDIFIKHHINFRNLEYIVT